MYIQILVTLRVVEFSLWCFPLGSVDIFHSQTQQAQYPKVVDEENN